MFVYHLWKTTQREMPRDRRPQRESSVIAVAQKRWILWQADFAMHCVRTMLTAREDSLTNVASPLALSTVLAMLYLGADEETKTEIAKAVKMPRGIASEVLRNFRDVLTAFSRSDSESRIRFCADLFLAKERKVKDAFAAQLQRFFGKKAEAWSESTFFQPSKEARLFAIAATVITAPWIADSTKDSRAYPFMSSYASRIRGHPYIVISGKFRCLSSRVYEAWMFPLGLSADSDIKPALIVIRPVFVGLLMDLVGRMHGFSLLGLIKRIQKQKEEKSRLLMPMMRIPLRQEDNFPTDLLKLSRNKRQNPRNRKSEDFSAVAEGCTNLDHLVHYGAVSFSKSGVGFANDDVFEPPSLLSDSTQQSNDDAATMPSKHSKPSPEIFTARFDSPFIFVIVDCKSGAPLSIGSYHGPRNVSHAHLRRPCQRPPFCAKQNVNDPKRCALM